ncbi:MAG: Photosystem I assembly protein Ycf3 [Ignavibacteriaceae bacterium]|nr:Photosystem I assembly protein Ycf3 [Ignavibacteriaceae bacterium]
MSNARILVYLFAFMLFSSASDLLAQEAKIFNHKYMEVDSAQSLHDQGVTDYEAGEYWTAVRKWMDCIPAYERGGEAGLLVSVLSNIGLAYENLYIPVLAAYYYELAYKTAVAANLSTSAHQYTGYTAGTLVKYELYSLSSFYFDEKRKLAETLGEGYDDDSEKASIIADSVKSASEWLAKNRASVMKTLTPSKSAFQTYLMAAVYSIRTGNYKDGDLFLSKASAMMQFAGPDEVILFSDAATGLEVAVRNYGKEIGTAPKRTKETAKNEFYILSVRYITPDSAEAVVAGGTADGLFVGSKGDISGAYFTDVEGHSSFYLGAIRVIKAGEFVSTIGIKLKTPGKEWKMVYPGDFAGLEVYTLERSFTSVLEKTAAINMNYRTLNNQILYSRFMLSRYNNASLEKRVVEALVDDLHASHERYSQYVNDYPTWTAPSEKGYLKGVSMMDGIKDASYETVSVYLTYVSEYPGSWNGKNSQFPVMFATWLLSDSPLNKSQLKQIIWESIGKAKPSEFMSRYGASLEDESLIGEIAGSIEDSIIVRAGEYPVQIAQLQYLDSLASYLPASWDYMKTNFELGQAYRDTKEYQKSGHHFRKARYLYIKGDYMWDAAETLHNDALNLQDQDFLKESAAMFDSAITLKMQVSAKDPSDALYETIGSSLWGKAWSIRYLNEYDEAIKIYQLSVAYYDSSKRQSAKASKLTVLDNIGEIYEKKGDHNRAIEHYFGMMPLIKELNNLQEEGEALNDIAYNYSQLGEYQKAIEYYTKGYEVHTKRGSSEDAGFSTSNIAQVYWTLGDYDKAIATHHNAIKLREQANDLAGQGYSWSKLGALYKESGDPAKGIEAFEKAVKFYELANDESGLADVYKDLGDLYLKVKDLSKAKEKLEKSLDIKRNLKDPFKLAEAYFDIASVYYQYVDYPNAELNWKKALELYEQIGDFSGRVYTLANLGLLEYVYHKRFNDALKTFNLAVRLSAEVNNDNNLAYCYQRISNLYKENGDVELSKKYIDSSYAIYVKLGDLAKISSTMVDIGYYFMSRGDFKTADSLFRQSQKIAVEANNNNQIAIANQSLADMALYTGEFKNALSILEETKKIYEKIDNFWGLASINLSLGNVYNHMGEFAKAIYHYDIADSLYASKDDDYSRATPINNKGTIYYWQGDHASALPQFLKVKEILEKYSAKNEFYAIVLSNAGEVLAEQKKFDEAKKYLDEAKKMADGFNFNSLQVTVNTIFAKMNIAQEKYEDAQKYIDEAYRLVKKSGEKDRLTDVANIKGKVAYYKKDFKTALQYLDESVSISRQIGTTRYLYQPLYMQGLIYRDQNQVDLGIKKLKEAIEVVEIIRVKLTGGEQAAKLFSAGEEKVKIYEEIISLYIQKNEIDSALIFLDKSNNEALKQQFGKLDVKFKDENKNEAINKEKDLKSKVNGIEEEIAKVKAKPESQQNKEYLESLEKSKNVAEKEYINFITQTVKEFPTLQNYFASNVNPKSFIRSKSKIPDDVAVLAYLMGENQLYIFAASRDTVVAKVIPVTREKIEKSVVKLYRLMKDSQIGKSLGDLDPATFMPKTSGKDLVVDSKLKPFLNTTDELFQTLVGPVYDIIKDKKKLSIIPYGKLYYLPFEALSSVQDDKRTFMNQKYSIFYISTLEIFTGQTDVEDIDFRVMAFGNADNTLPNSETEVNDLKKIFESSKIYVRNEASEDKVKNLTPDFNALHFATHGNLDYNKVENSYLTLAANDIAGEDGKLTIEEVWGLSNLNQYNLVTLSACQTAVSDEIIQGWMVNPANAFFDVGVKTVIASLWQVDDEATSILMNAFYKNLKTMNKVQALQEAKRVLQQNPKFVFPYYWASFVMVGDYK